MSEAKVDQTAEASRQEFARKLLSDPNCRKLVDQIGPYETTEIGESETADPVVLALELANVNFGLQFAEGGFRRGAAETPEGIKEAAEMAKEAILQELGRLARRDNLALLRFGYTGLLVEAVQNRGGGVGTVRNMLALASAEKAKVQAS